MFVQIPSNSFGYRFRVEEPLRQGEYITDAYYDNPIIFSFLEKNLRINMANRDSINANMVEMVQLLHGRGKVLDIEGKRVVVTLRGVTDNGGGADVQIQISGRNPIQREVINQGSEKIFYFSNLNVSVRVRVVQNSDGITNDFATLYVGSDKSQLYHSGDPFIGEDQENPIFVWNLKDLDTPNPVIEIRNTFGIDNWDETENPLVKHALYEGDYLCLPNNYACLIFEKMNEADNGFQKYTIKDTIRTISDENNDPVKRENMKVIEFKAIGGRDQGFVAAGIDTEAIIIGINQTKIILARKEQDGSEYIVFRTLSVIPAVSNLHTISQSNGDFFIDYDHSYIPIRINQKPEMTLNLDLGTIGKSDGDIIIRILNDTPTSFNYLGKTDSDLRIANDVLYNNMGTFYDISGKEENLRTKHGVIIHDPKFNSKSDQFSFAVPKNVNNYRAFLRIAKPGTSKDNVDSEDIPITATSSSSGSGSGSGRRNNPT